MDKNKLYGICGDKNFEEAMKAYNGAAVPDSSEPLSAGRWVWATFGNFDASVPPIIETGNHNIISSIVSVENGKLTVMFYNISNEEQSLANAKVYYRVANA